MTGIFIKLIVVIILWYISYHYLNLHSIICHLFFNDARGKRTEKPSSTQVSLILCIMVSFYNVTWIIVAQNRKVPNYSYIYWHTSFVIPQAEVSEDDIDAISTHLKITPFFPQSMNSVFGIDGCHFQSKLRTAISWNLDYSAHNPPS